MSDDELVRLEREAAELQARIRELRAAPRNVADLNRLTPREIAALPRDVLNAALAAGHPTLADPSDPAGPGLTGEHLRRMSPDEVLALRASHPDAVDVVLAGGHAVLNGSNGKG